MTMPSSDLATWPGREWREPRRSDADYLLRYAIATSLADARDRYVGPGSRILDVGCGIMPYFPLFADVAAAYEGTDITPGPNVTYVCPIESLAAPSESYDVVLCTQVLEHVRYPREGLAELVRVLRPGGHLLVTTHGVFPFHPNPTDYWRWTQQGFEAMFEEIPHLELVELVPHGGTASAFALLTSLLLDMAANRLRARRLARPLIAGLNTLGPRLDRTSPRLRYPEPKTLISNFLAIGRKGG